MSWLITPTERTPLDQDYRNVSLLLHGNGTNGSTTITDNSPTPKTVTAVGNAQISTAQSKFGGASIAFDGSGDYLDISSGFVTGTENFTIEWWELLAATNVAYAFIYISSLPSPIVGIKTGNNSVQIYSSDATNNINVTCSYSSSSTQWQHIAITRENRVIRIFAGGTLCSYVANLSPNYSFTGTGYSIGRAWPSIYTNSFNGYIDDLRITKGVARYTANFTPPTAPFPDAGPAQ